MAALNPELRGIEGIYMFQTGEVVPVSNGEIVLFRLYSGIAELISQIGAFDYRKDSSSPEQIRLVSWFYDPVLYLRNPEEYEPSRTPVSRNYSSGFSNFADCFVGIDEICEHLEDDLELKAHAEWVQELKRPYHESLARIFSEHRSERIKPERIV